MMALGLLLLSVASAETNEIRFPYTLVMGSEAHFILHGEELANPLTFSYEGGCLLINGRKAFPPVPSIVPSPLSDADLRRLCGGVPFVQRRTAETGSIRQAVDELEAKRNAMIDRVGAAWRTLRDEFSERLDSLPSAEESKIYDAIADSALQFLDDPDVVGDLETARRDARLNMYGKLVFYTPGEFHPEGVAFIGHAPSPVDHEQYSEAKLLERVRSYVQALRHDGPAVVLISRSGTARAIGGDASRLLEDVAAIRADSTFEAHHLSREQAYEIRHPRE